ncbi:MAG: HEAT repeat domain-containing protein [Planctomycetota bacterium JB042]
MTEGRSRLTNRVMDAIRADERALASRRRRVAGGLAILVVLAGGWFVSRTTTVVPGDPGGRAEWMAALSGEDDEAAATALRSLARLYLVEGDEAAGEAVIEASRTGRLRGERGGIDLFGLLATAAREDRAEALRRARTMLVLRETEVASFDLDWDALLNGLGDLSDEDEIWCVLFYLESFDPDDAAPYLGWVAAQLGHASDDIRVRALQTLRRLAPVGIENALVAMLQSGTPRERQVALLVASDLDLADETESAVLGVLGDPDPTVRLRAAQTLADFGNPANAAAVAALASDGECLVRVQAAWAAARLGDPQHVDSLVPVAQGDVPTGCVESLSGDPVKLALTALAALGDGRGGDAAEGHITEFLAGTAGKGLVIPSLLALEQLQRTSAIPLVMALETTGDTSLWIQAAATLHVLGSPQGSLVLNSYFYGPNEGYRTQAINAAARLRDEIFRDDFEDLQGHESPQTRDAADRAIDRLDQPDAGS